MTATIERIKNFLPQALKLYADYNKSAAIKSAITSSKHHRTPTFPNSLPPRSESLHIIRTTEAIMTAGPVAMLATLPMVGYPIMVAAFLVPQYSLSHHFWTESETATHYAAAVSTMSTGQTALLPFLSSNPTIPTSLLSFLSSRDKSHLLGILSLFHKDYNRANLPPDHLLALAVANNVLHGLPFLTVAPRLLTDRKLQATAATITSDSLALASQRPKITPQELAEACTRRGLSINVDMLTDFVDVVDAVNDEEGGESFVLHLGALLKEVEDKGWRIYGQG